MLYQMFVMFTRKKVAYREYRTGYNLTLCSNKCIPSNLMKSLGYININSNFKNKKGLTMRLVN